MNKANLLGHIVLLVTYKKEALLIKEKLNTLYPKSKPRLELEDSWGWIWVSNEFYETIMNFISYNAKEPMKPYSDFIFSTSISELRTLKYLHERNIQHEI